MKWRDLLIKQDDIISGYNIYAFDFTYIWDREELGILNRYDILGLHKRSQIKENNNISA